MARIKSSAKLAYETKRECFRAAGFRRCTGTQAVPCRGIGAPIFLPSKSGASVARAPSRYGIFGVAVRRVTVTIGLYSVRLSEGSDPAIHMVSSATVWQSTSLQGWLVAQLQDCRRRAGADGRI